MTLAHGFGDELGMPAPAGQAAIGIGSVAFLIRSLLHVDS